MKICRWGASSQGTNITTVLFETAAKINSDYHLDCEAWPAGYIHAQISNWICTFLCIGAANLSGNSYTSQSQFLHHCHVAEGITLVLNNHKKPMFRLKRRSYLIFMAVHWFFTFKWSVLFWINGPLRTHSPDAALISSNRHYYSTV